MYLPVQKYARGTVENEVCCVGRVCCLASGSVLGTNEMEVDKLSLAGSRAFPEETLCRLVGSKA